MQKYEKIVKIKRKGKKKCSFTIVKLCKITNYP